MTQSVELPATPGRASVAELRAEVLGDVLEPDHPAYDDARALWNAAVDRHPALVVRCTGAADVLAAVRFARSEGLPLAVRGGGHSVAGLSSCDGGLVVDLSPMRGVRVDAEARRVVAEPGLRWRDVDHETSAHGLAVTGGLVSDTGIAGYTLGGGLGWLARRFGLACDNLLGADVVTADGRLLHADAGSSPDLLWALRGGGGGLGVVTTFELGLHPLGADVLLSRVYYPAADAHSVLRGWRSVTMAAPDELASMVQLAPAPAAPALPPSLHGRPVVAVLSVHSGRRDVAERETRPLRRLATPLADVTEVLPYPVAQAASDAQWVSGAHNYFTSLFLRNLHDDALDELVGRRDAAPAGRCEIHLHRLGGAVARMPSSSTAFPHRSAPYVLNVIARAPDAAGFAGQVAWARSTRAALEPVGLGGYVNWSGVGDDALRRAAHPPDVAARLARVRARYDPTGLFGPLQPPLPHDPSRRTGT